MISRGWALGVVAAACAAIAMAPEAHGFAGLWVRGGSGVRPAANAMHVVLEASRQGWRVIVWHAYAGDDAPVSLVLPVPADADVSAARALPAEVLGAIDESFGPIVTPVGCDHDAVTALRSLSFDHAHPVRAERFVRASEIAAMPAGATELDVTPGIAWWRVAFDPREWPRRPDGSFVPDAIAFEFAGDPARLIVPLRAALFDAGSREVVVDVVDQGRSVWSGARVAPVPSPIAVDSSVRLGFPAFYAGFVDAVFTALPGPTVIEEFASDGASRFRTRIDVHSMQTDAVIVAGSTRVGPSPRLVFETADARDGGAGCERFGLPLEGTTSSPRHRFDVARVVHTPIPGVIHAASPLVAGVVRTAEREIVRERQTQRRSSRSCGCDVRSSRASGADLLSCVIALSIVRRRRRSSEGSPRRASAP